MNVRRGKEIGERYADKSDLYVLGGSRVHEEDVELGKEMVEHLAQTRLDHSEFHVLLLDLCLCCRWDFIT